MSTYAEAMAAAGPRMKLISEHAGDAEQMSVPGERRGIDTMGMYGTWSGNEFVGWTEERRAFQAAVLDRMELEQIVANDGRLPRQDRQVVIMAGLPGSGKTHLIKTQLPGQLDPRDFITVNADDIKERIIHDDHPPAVLDLEGMELSTMVHEESSWMAKDWERRLTSQGTNMILDITAANRERTLAKIESLKRAGYTVHIMHSDITPQEALASATRRAVESAPTPGKIGRIVPESFITGMAAEGDRDVIDEAFPEYAQAANGRVWSFRNYPISRRPPVLTFSKRRFAKRGERR
jgi:predicted ABC-type ATPase